MRCNYCPLCPRDDICPESESNYGIEYKNGEYGCKHPRNWVEKRNKEYDEYYSNMGSDMGIEMSLTENEFQQAIKLCKHMIGLDCKKPYHRHGKAFYRSYRNYFCAPICGDIFLDKLPSFIIEKKISEKSVWYKLTSEGISWLSRQLKITIIAGY
jgi:hypothetical protein